MRPSQVNIHITRQYFTAAMLEDRGGLELSYMGAKQFPLDALSAFELSLTARGYVRLAGVFDWLRHYEQRPVMVTDHAPDLPDLPDQADVS